MRPNRKRRRVADDESETEDFDDSGILNSDNDESGHQCDSEKYIAIDLELHQKANTSKYKSFVWQHMEVFKKK